MLQKCAWLYDSSVFHKELQPLSNSYSSFGRNIPVVTDLKNLLQDSSGIFSKHHSQLATMEWINYPTF